MLSRCVSWPDAKFEVPHCHLCCHHLKASVDSATAPCCPAVLAELVSLLQDAPQPKLTRPGAEAGAAGGAAAAVGGGRGGSSWGEAAAAGGRRSSNDAAAAVGGSQHDARAHQKVKHKLFKRDTQE